VKRQIGLEKTPDEFVATMVEVFRLVREVLADDGTLWLNMGDAYAQSGGQLRGVNETRDKAVTRQTARGTSTGQHGGWESRASRAAHTAVSGLKPKDLCGMPWRVAFALQADGWYLRSDIIWHKPNPMPESVTDRPTKSHEYLFLLTKGPRYFYDANAVREPHAESSKERGHLGRDYAGRGDRGGKMVLRAAQGLQSDSTTLGGFIHNPAGRNRRTVWTIATSPFPGAHFATFPPKLVEPCILAGTSEKGHCPECGARWVRVVEKPDFSSQPKRQTSKDAHLRNGDRTSAGQAWQEWRNANPDKQLGFRPTCDHRRKPVPDVCLDPFFGAGTVGMVAEQLGRDYIGIELNRRYSALAREAA
jgi:DNA modification methylase